MLGRSRTAAEISGYVGGEKIGLLEDEEVQDLIQRKYHLKIDYSRAGSIEMVTADHTGMDFLFPSSQTALELYETQFGKMCIRDRYKRGYEKIQPGIFRILVIF